MKPSPAFAVPKHQVFDVLELRKDFPVLLQKAHGKPLIYFDLSLIHI